MIEKIKKMGHHSFNGGCISKHFVRNLCDLQNKV